MNYRITNKADGVTEMLIYDDIGGDWFGGISAKQVVSDLAKIKTETLNVRINSAGGDVFEGFAIYNAIARHESRKVVDVDGLAASIASVIAMAGDEIIIAENARMMIHNAWGMTAGDASAVRRFADLLDSTTSQIREIYAARTSLPMDVIAGLMDDETWLTAGEAVEMGFATAAGQPLKVAAAVYDPEKFRRPRASAKETQEVAPWRLAAARRKIALTKVSRRV